ncbi:hypothetical protein PCO31110_01018 [Pandoraea communis]|uniref:Uncharacterized protein n=1 Tax=Pandoraea communis TaxID=2508297 RepID=A0A5E4SWK5_9BURK|nr:hypothetical protein PCO31110_01018 [Pandoraea communis]
MPAGNTFWTCESKNLTVPAISLVTASKTNINHFLHHARQVEKTKWRDCIREPAGQRKNIKIIHKTPFSGVSCTKFRRLWITLWITYRTRCAWVRDNLRIFPQGAKTVPSCPWDTRCLSIQFSFGQLSVYTALTVVIHRSELPLLTTTMYTYSKPIKTLKTDYERRENRKTRSARTVENAALAVRDPALPTRSAPLAAHPGGSSCPVPQIPCAANPAGNKKPRQGGVSSHRSHNDGCCQRQTVGKRRRFPRHQVMPPIASIAGEPFR